MTLWYSEGALEFVYPGPEAKRGGRDDFARVGGRALVDELGEVRSSFAIGLSNSFCKKRE